MPFLISISTGDAGSVKSLLLNESAKNPLLNLSSPSASLICKFSIFCSKKDSVVTFSKCCTLSSITPMSRIVYLRLSTKNICTSSTSNVYGGQTIVAIVIASGWSAGGWGTSWSTPWSNTIPSVGLRTNLSILAR